MKKLPVFILLFASAVCLRVSAQCSAAFSVSPVTALARQFCYEGIADNSLQFGWNFGDGSTSSEQSPFHAFADTGFFHVCLNVKSKSGHCHYDSCIAIRIDTCQADFSYQYVPASLQPEQAAYYFWDGSSGTNTSTSYEWKFGNGDVSGVRNPSFIYGPDDAGPQTVCLSIHNKNNGCTSKYCRDIMVDTLCVVAQFSYQIRGDSVYFNAEPCGHWTNINWDFGDGQTARAGERIVHKYKSIPAVYTACVRIEYDKVCQRGFACKGVLCQDINMCQH